MVYLFFYNGMDYDEISEIMNIDVQTVRNYMSMAIKKIRNVFNVEGEYFTG